MQKSTTTHKLRQVSAGGGTVAKNSTDFFTSQIQGNESLKSDYFMACL